MNRLENVRIVLKDRVITGTIVYEHSKIVKVIEHDCDFQNTVIPGFVDIRTRGGFGFDFMDGRTNGGFELYTENLLTSGVTSVVQATNASTQAELKKAIQDYVRYTNLPKQDRRAKHLGINIAGVWINKFQPGNNNADLIEESELTQAINLLELSQDKIIMAEIAMEIEANRFIGRWLKEKGKTILLANTEITMNDSKEYFAKGYYDGVSNLFNNMIGFDPYKPGLVPTVLNDRHIKAVMPIDERKMNFDLLVHTIKNYGTRKITLSSFSSKDGNYKLIDGFKKLRTQTDIPLYELCKMFSTNPARLINYGSRIGQIKEGYSADLVILDNDFDIVKVIVNGK